MGDDAFVYVGTYTEPIRFGTGKILEGKGKGIYCYRFDRSSGAMELVGLTTGVTNPSYLALDQSRRYLYAVNEFKEFEGRPSGTVSAFAVDPATHSLKFLNKQLTHGTDPCHVEVESRGRHVFVANFASGSVCILPVRGDGSLGEACDFVQHIGSSIDPNRQRGPHAHSVILDAAERFAFVPDLGLDKLMIYRYDAERGMFEPNASPHLKAKPGAGPRHLAFHPAGKFAYLINELDSTVTALRYDATRAAFEPLQTVPTLPGDYQGASTCADVHVSPDGTFVYSSNRGHDSLAIHRIDGKTGMLSYVGHASTQGRTPRNFAIDPTGEFLLAANQDSDTIVVFRIDRKTGALAAAGRPVDVPTPVCVRFV
jgi:6-phosphogluconolactonase